MILDLGSARNASAVKPERAVNSQQRAKFGSLRLKPESYVCQNIPRVIEATNRFECRGVSAVVCDVRSRCRQLLFWAALPTRHRPSTQTQGHHSSRGDLSEPRLLFQT